MKRKQLLSTLLMLILALISACSPFVTSTPPPSPQPIRVAYTPTLRPIAERLHQCALEHPEIGLIVQETSATGLQAIKSDVTLWFGEPPQGIPGFAISLGMDEIIMITGTEVTLQNVSTNELQALYKSANPPYHIWTYSAGNELRKIFDDAVLGESSTTPDTLLAPNPAAMIEAIDNDPMAIGYLPQSWLTEDHQRLSIDHDLSAAFEHPILALTDTEPEGNLHTYLVCLQNTTP